jgi:hypothetical protein
LSGFVVSGAKKVLSLGLGDGGAFGAGLELANMAAVVDLDSLAGTGGLDVREVVAEEDGCEDCVWSKCGGFGGCGLINVLADTLLRLLIFVGFVVWFIFGFLFVELLLVSDGSFGGPTCFCGIGGGGFCGAMCFAGKFKFNLLCCLWGAGGVGLWGTFGLN